MSIVRIHGAGSAEIRKGNTLAAPHWTDGEGNLKTFDFVVANPPFSQKNWTSGVSTTDDPYNRFELGTPPAKNGDYAFLLHILKSLKSQGKAAVILPHGVLFRGNAEEKIRRNLIARGVIKGIIGLPPNLFYSTTIPACILVFRDQKAADRKNHVLFVDGSARFVKGKNQNRMTDEDIKILIEAYETGEDPDGEGGANVRLVPFDEIKDNGFDLNIGRYIKVAAEETADLGTALVGYADARQKRLQAEAAMFERLAAAGIDLSMFEVPSE